MVLSSSSLMCSGTSLPSNLHISINSLVAARGSSSLLLENVETPSSCTLDFIVIFHPSNSSCSEDDVLSLLGLDTAGILEDMYLCRIVVYKTLLFLGRVNGTKTLVKGLKKVILTLILRKRHVRKAQECRYSGSRRWKSKGSQEDAGLGRVQRPRNRSRTWPRACLGVHTVTVADQRTAVGNPALSFRRCRMTSGHKGQALRPPPQHRPHSNSDAWLKKKEPGL